MKQICYITLLLSLCFVGYSQTNGGGYWQEMKQIKQAKQPDTAQVNLWLAVARKVSSNKPDSALYFANQALLVSDKLAWDKGIADAYYESGTAHRIVGNYPRALADQLKALRIYETQKDSLGLSKATMAIATIYWFEDNYDKALQYNRKALEIAEAQRNLDGISKTLNNIGILLHDKKSYKEALTNYFKSLKISEQLNNKRSMASALHNIGEVYADVGDMSRGFEYLNQSLKIGEEINDKNFVANTLIVMSQLYQKQGNIEESVRYAEKGFLIAETIGSKEYMKDASNVLYADYKLRHNMTRALEYYELYVNYRDSLFNESNHKQIAHLQASYELEKKQNQIETLAKETKLQQEANKEHIFVRQVLIAFVIAILIILGLFIKSNLDRKRTNQLLLQQKREIEEKREELAKQQQQIIQQNKTLSSQNNKLVALNAEKDGLVGIVAHDLRAPLNRIKGFAQILSFEENLNEDQQMMLKRIDKTCNAGIALIKDLLLINNIEYESAKLKPTDIDLLVFLKNFIEQFEAQAQAKQIKLHFIFPNHNVSLQTDENFFSRILDNLLSNAIKFTHRGKNIYVQCEEKDDKVIVSIKDEGQGLSLEDQQKLFIKFQKLTAKPTGGEESTGLGLAIVKALVDKLQGEISVESEVDKGATFIVSFNKKLS